ncbi:diacylglycerol kinase [Colwellia echini]|uniref:Diacylglycerol kinase n=1 Tax=Colwellia echini TaxID=1982103 RepID=A0ABY3N196_9GAMM|nr:diacylglycerol kinase [Colwellia echini]TYK67264.1 diacylglycerol kinase [Colwellia echini]
MSEKNINNKKQPCGIKRIYLASLNSLSAFKWLYKNEASFRQELLLLLIAVPITFLFNISVLEQVILILAIIFIIFTEVINTAIEAVVDRVGLEIHPLSGLAKDLGSAAVLLSMVIAISLWLVILL